MVQDLPPTKNFPTFKIVFWLDALSLRTDIAIPILESDKFYVQAKPFGGFLLIC